jgi:hypothetical protein
MQPLTQMQTAYDHFNKHRTTLKMTTGSANLDSLIDSIQEGQFYLFYGSNKAILDGIVHGLLVNCVLPVREKHGFESMAMYVNDVDYYQPDKSKVLSPEKIAIAAKCAGIGKFLHPAKKRASRYRTLPYLISATQDKSRVAE